MGRKRVWRDERREATTIAIERTTLALIDKYRAEGETKGDAVRRAVETAVRCEERERQHTTEQATG